MSDYCNKCGQSTAGDVSPLCASCNQEESELAPARGSASDTELLNALERNPMLIGVTACGEWQAAFQGGENTGKGYRAKTLRELLEVIKRQNDKLTP